MHGFRAYFYIFLTREKNSFYTWKQMCPATAKDLLPMLPGEWAERALQRVKEYPYSPDKEVTTLAKALECAIAWVKTPEGHEVWLSLSDALYNHTEIPECPPNGDASELAVLRERVEKLENCLKEIARGYQEGQDDPGRGHGAVANALLSYWKTR